MGEKRGREVWGEKTISYNSQEELDNKTIQEAKKWISEAFEIFNFLIEKSKTITENKDFYFSHEFYQKNPRGKQAKKKYPK